MNRDEQERALSEIFEYYSQIKNPQEQDNLVTMLREIQEVCGCVPADLQQRAADTAGVKLSSITCLMKLYKSLKPAAYRHKILMCTGPRCMAKNSGLVELVRKELNIDKSGLSSDGQIFLDTQSCLKQCKTAPNMMIDGVLHTNLTEDKVRRLIGELGK